jgi:hypothetical protein
MSTQPSESRHDQAENNSLEVVFSRFTLDSDRRTRRHARTTHRRTDVAPPVRGSVSAAAQWPAADIDSTGTENQASFPPAQPPEQASADDDPPAAYIRPYSWTGGRTRSNYALELETLVSTSEMCQYQRLERLEQQSIAELCRHPRSVAEVGALLGVPLGVAKVLLGDMADLGLVTVHHTVTSSGSTSHLLLMERVLSGLRRL